MWLIFEITNVMMYVDIHSFCIFNVWLARATLEVILDWFIWWWISLYTTNVLMYGCDYRPDLYVECLASASHFGCYLWLIICVLSKIIENQCIDVCECTIESLLMVNIWHNQCNDVCHSRILWNNLEYSRIFIILCG